MNFFNESQNLVGQHFVCSGHFCAWPTFSCAHYFTWVNIWRNPFVPFFCFNGNLKTTFPLWHIFQFASDLDLQKSIGRNLRIVETVLRYISTFSGLLDVPVQKSLHGQLNKLLFSRIDPIWPFYCQLGTNFCDFWLILENIGQSLNRIVNCAEKICHVHRIYEGKSLLEIVSFLQMITRCSEEKSWQSLESCSRTLFY